jgi:hypothetical protein
VELLSTDFGGSYQYVRWLQVVVCLLTGLLTLTPAYEHRLLRPAIQTVSGLFVGITLLLAVQACPADQRDTYFLMMGMHFFLFKSVAAFVLPSLLFLVVGSIETAYFIGVNLRYRSLPIHDWATVCIAFASFSLFFGLARALEKSARVYFVQSKVMNQAHLNVEVESVTHSFLPKKKARPSIFISYCHKNSEFAFRLKRMLIDSGRYEVWIDNQIRGGQDWRDEVGTAIKDASAVVFVVSPDSVKSTYCAEEIHYARIRSKPIFPVIFQRKAKKAKVGVFDLLDEGLKMILQRIQWIDFEKEAFRIASDKLLGLLLESSKQGLSGNTRAGQVTLGQDR